MSAEVLDFAELGRQIDRANGLIVDDASAAPEGQGSDVHAFLAEPEPSHDWLLEGVLERGDRLIVTGPEGGGKSTLLRQMGVQLAAGIHPFALELVPPARVLLLDLENPRRLLRRALAELVDTADGALAPGRLTVLPWEEGIDLADPAHETWLTGQLEAVGAEVLITGPLYKLGAGDANDAADAKPIALALDRIRHRLGVTMLIEAHAGHAQGGGRRPRRPLGWSGWLRWPEFGLYLGETGAIERWRGDRDERQWPAALTRGGRWPWSPGRPQQATLARMIEVCRERGTILSYRDLAAAIGTSKATVERAIAANRLQWGELVDELG